MPVQATTSHSSKQHLDDMEPMEGAVTAAKLLQHIPSNNVLGYCEGRNPI